jgi:hypothetical protein
MLIFTERFQLIFIRAEALVITINQINNSCAELMQAFVEILLSAIQAGQSLDGIIFKNGK